MNWFSSCPPQFFQSPAVTDPHLLSTQISAGECCSKSNTPWCTNRKLQSWQLPRLVTCQKHPAFNGEQKTSMTLLFNNYSPTILQYGSAAGIVVSVAIKKKIQAECLCLALHLPLRRQDGGHWVRKVHIVAHSTFLPLWGQHPGPVGTLLLLLSTQTKYSKYGKYGYRNTALANVSTPATRAKEVEPSVDTDTLMRHRHYFMSVMS